MIGEGIRAVAAQLDDAMPALERRLAEVAVAFAFVGRMFVIGRGPEFATAREISLKLLETCRVAAEPLTATDLMHGPLAALDGLFPGLDDRLGRREPARRSRRRSACPRRGRDAGRERTGCPRDRRSRVLGARPNTGGDAALATALGRSGTAARVGARAGQGARPRPPERPQQDHARALDAWSVPVRAELSSSPAAAGREPPFQAVAGRARSRKCPLDRTDSMCEPPADHELVNTISAAALLSERSCRREEEVSNETTFVRNGRARGRPCDRSGLSDRRVAGVAGKGTGRSHSRSG